MSIYLLVLYVFVVFAFLIVLSIFKRSKDYWFWLVSWQNGAWKTQGVTNQLLVAKFSRINITNYYTWYTHIQIATAEDVIAVMYDIYNYHIYFNLLRKQKRLHTLKKPFLIRYIKWFSEWLHTLDDLDFPAVSKYRVIVDNYIYDNIGSYWDNFDNLVLSLEESSYFNLFPEKVPFNIVMDETSRMFDAREFSSNFAWEKAWFKNFMYELRKYKVLFYLIVQSIEILDVNFSRMALQFRHFYHGLGVYRWYRDLVYPNPNERNIDTAHQVWWWPIFGAIINLHPIWIKYPLLDYETEEPIFDSYSIYERGHLYTIIKKFKPKKQSFYVSINYIFSDIPDIIAKKLLDLFSRISLLCSRSSALAPLLRLYKRLWNEEKK